MICYAPCPLTERVRDHYDGWDLFYRELLGTQIHHGLWNMPQDSLATALANMTNMVLAAAQLAPDMDLCDVGCGYGEMCRRAVAECGCHATGVTVSERQARFAEKLGEGTVRVVHQDWTTNSLPTAAFDRVIAVESLEHMPDLDLAIANIARVLRPGGRAVICTLVRTTHAEPGLDHLADGLNLAPLRHDEDLTAGFSRAGLIKTSMRDLTTHVAPTWRHSLRAGIRHAVTNAACRQVVFPPRQANVLFLRAVARLNRAYRRGQLAYLMYEVRKPVCEVESGITKQESPSPVSSLDS